MRGESPLRPSASLRATSPMKGEENVGVTLLTKEDVEALHPDDQARLAWDGAAHRGQRAPSGPWRT